MKPAFIFSRRHVLLRRVRNAGVGLVEMMVAVVIALFVILAVANIYLSMRSSFTNQDQLAQLQDSERLVLTMLTTTVQSAGYFVNPLVDTAATALPAATVSRDDGSSSAFSAGQSVVGTGDGTGTGANSDTISVRFQTANNDGLMNCQGGTNTTGATTVFSNYFAVDANNELTCTVGPGKPLALAANVGQMKVLYGTDTNGDGNPDTYLPASAVTSANLWSAVYTAQVWIEFLDTTASKPGAPVFMPKPVVQTVNLMNKQ